MNTDLELQAVGASFTPLELTLPENLSMEDWARVGRSLTRADKMMKWWIGDWAAFGDRKYGALKDFCAANDLEFQTVANYCWVSGSVETSRRREVVSWSHHAEVAALSPREQSKWLAKVEKDKLSKVDLRKAIRLSHATENANDSDGPIIKFISRHLDELLSWLKGREKEWWNEARRQHWRVRLEPLVRFYESL